jgi:hypothetical protein
MKLIGKKHRGNIQVIGKGGIFLGRILNAQEAKTKLDKWYCIKLKNFCKIKETINRVRRHCTEWEKQLTIVHLTKGSSDQRVNIPNI